MGRQFGQSSSMIKYAGKAALLLFCSAAIGVAQDPVRPPEPVRTQEPIFRVDVRLVRLLATVKNAAGDLVGSLGPKDFAVRDNDIVQEISVFEHQTTQPLSVTLLIDTSGSTGKDLKFETASLVKFLDALVREGNPDDAVSLYAFNYQVTLINSFTRRLSRVEDNLKRLAAEGGTSLYDAIYLAAPPLRDREGRHVIVAVPAAGTTTTSKKSNQPPHPPPKASPIFSPY